MNDRNDWARKIRRVSLTRENTRFEDFMVDAFIWLVITPFVWIFFLVFAVPEFLFGTLLNLIRGKEIDKTEVKELLAFFKQPKG